MDITAFTPVLRSFVVAGDMASQLSLLQLPGDQLMESHICPDQTDHHPQISVFHHFRALGKVSRAPVADVVAAENTAVAASGRAVATWDLVGGTRVRHLDAPQAVARCAFVAPQLVAAVGEACAVHLWDVRGASAAPAVSVKVARDNLYALAVRAGDVYTGGADGAVYHVDLRAQRAHRSTVPGGRGAVLDLAPVHLGVAAILEAGAVVGVPMTGRDLSFVEQLVPFSHRVVGAVVEEESGLQVAVGGDDGRVCIIEGAGARSGDGRNCYGWQVARSKTRVPVVRMENWGTGATIYACAGPRVVAGRKPVHQDTPPV